MSDSIKLKSIIYPYESITEMNDKLRESLWIKDDQNEGINDDTQE
jgi:hypothetical protein